MSEIKGFYNERLDFIKKDNNDREHDYCTVIVDAPEGMNYSYHLLEFHVGNGEVLSVPSLGINKRIFNDEEIKVNK